MDLMQLLYDINGFLDRGGAVLYAITIAAFVLWFLIFERLLFIHFRANREMKSLTAVWSRHSAREEAQRIRESLQSDFEHKLLFTLPLIQTLVRITPLLGLFGTVYGMIEIFDVIAQQGTGDARALANGISMATLPTMTGMAVAIVGLFFIRFMESSANRKISQLNAGMQ
ncbi:MAG TPA: biopolymer transporter ExbB [Gammaproteobacteria bacterium]|jgi:biopolymer transport protein ExbB|nr:biopolymer transporter ExbB [Gammaproteobacteria bacterium]